MKRTILFTIYNILFVLSLSAASVDSLKAVADSVYAKEDFDKAAKLYHRIAKVGESAAICYNLGNCYYRKDDIAKAILWYERAAMLSPGDEDIRFNLDMARSKTIDRVVPRHEFFFVEWYKAMVNWMSVDAWAWLGIVLFVLSLLAFAVYIYGNVLWVRKTGFTLAFVLLLMAVMANVCAFSQRGRMNERRGAIVMVPSAVVKSTPSKSGSDLFVLHEGTAVKIKDDSLSEWCEVSLADGKQGWIEKRMIEII